MARKNEPEIRPDRYFTTPIGHVRDRVIINESSEIPKEGMFISLNGFPFLVKPGIEVDLPRPVLRMLDTRIKTETIHQDDGNGRIVEHKRNIPRITYRIIKEGINIPEPEPVVEAQMSA